MTDTEKVLRKIAVKCKRINGRNCVEERELEFESLAIYAGLAFYYAGDKPHGKSCMLTEMKNCYRFFIRCGYGRYNYAPCYEILK